MAWLPLALAAPALLTVVNFIDKYIVEREVPDTRAMPIFAGVIGLLAAGLLWIFGLVDALPPLDSLWTIGAGILIIAAAAFYFMALPLAQASAIIILLQITPVFILTLAWLLLGETITAAQLAGFWLILAAAVGVSIEGSGGRFHLGRAFVPMLIVNVLTAVSTLMLRLLSTSPSFPTLAAYQGVGQAIGALLVYLALPPFRAAFDRALTTTHRRGLGMIAFNESQFLVARALFNQANQAVTLGPAALVSVLGGTQVFYAILFGWGLMFIAPTVYREAVRQRDLLRKLAFAALMFVGLVFVIGANEAE